MLIDLLIAVVCIVLIAPVAALVWSLPTVQFPLGGIIVLIVLAVAGFRSVVKAWIAPALKEIVFGQIIWRVLRWKCRRRGMLRPHSPMRR